MQTQLIYLHGFLSSPQSIKAQQTLVFLTQHYPEHSLQIPQLPNCPDQLEACLDELMQVNRGKALGFIGSSMGGYLATYLVERYGGKAVLINPAVRPYQLLLDYLGEHTNPYTQQTFSLEKSHMVALRRLEVPKLADPGCYWALLQTGDETLDYRQAADKYAHARLSIEPDGDHSFQGYANFLPQIMDFLLK